MADQFMNEALPNGSRECPRRNGGVVRLEPKSGTIGLLGPDGYVLSFFVYSPLGGSNQTAIDYFRLNCR